MKAAATTLGAFIFILSICCSCQKLKLFNGKNLHGWHTDIPAMDTSKNATNPFIIRNSLLVSLGTPQGHLITNKKFANYRLTVEYRFTGKPGNCGVLVHASQPRALYNMFPKSIECQLEHGNAGDFWCIVENIAVPDMENRRGPKANWGTTEGKERHIVNLSNNSEKPLGQWNRMIIECLKDTVKVWVNGDMVNEGYDATAIEGQIAIQAEGSEVEFRRLDLLTIKKLSADNNFK